MSFDFAEAAKHAQTSQLELVTACGNTVLRSVEMLAPIGLGTARGALDEAATFASTLPGATSPADVLTLHRDFSQAIIDSTTTAARSAYDIVLDTQANLSRLINGHLAGLHATVSEATGDRPASAERKTRQTA